MNVKTAFSFPDRVVFVGRILKHQLLPFAGDGYHTHDHESGRCFLRVYTHSSVVVTGVSLIHVDVIRPAFFPRPLPPLLSHRSTTQALCRTCCASFVPHYVVHRSLLSCGVLYDIISIRQLRRWSANKAHKEARRIPHTTESLSCSFRGREWR